MDFLLIHIKVYNCMMVIACSAIIVFDKFLAGLLYAKKIFSLRGNMYHG